MCNIIINILIQKRYDQRLKKIESILFLMLGNVVVMTNVGRKMALQTSNKTYCIFVIN